MLCHQRLFRKWNNRAVLTSGRKSSDCRGLAVMRQTKFPAAQTHGGSCGSTRIYYLEAKAHESLGDFQNELSAAERDIATGRERNAWQLVGNAMNAKSWYGTQMLQQTGNLALVMRAMGQTSTKAAMQYQHPDLEHIRTALNVTRARTEQENRIN